MPLVYTGGFLLGDRAVFGVSCDGAFMGEIKKSKAKRCGEEARSVYL